TAPSSAPAHEEMPAAPASAVAQNTVPIRQTLDLPIPREQPTAVSAITKPLTVSPAEAAEANDFFATSFAVLTPPVNSDDSTHRAEAATGDVMQAPTFSNRSHNSPSLANHSASPAYLFNPKPRYPKDARARRQQGQVIVALDVTADGLPERVDVTQTS